MRFVNFLREPEPENEPQAENTGKNLSALLAIVVLLLAASICAGVLFYGDYRIRYEYFERKYSTIKDELAKMNNDIDYLREVFTNLDTTLERYNENFAQRLKESRELYADLLGSMGKVEESITKQHKRYVYAILNMDKTVRDLEEYVGQINDKLISLQYETTTIKNKQIEELRRFETELLEKLSSNYQTKNTIAQPSDKGSAAPSSLPAVK